MYYLCLGRASACNRIKGYFVAHYGVDSDVYVSVLVISCHAWNDAGLVEVMRYLHVHLNEVYCASVAVVSASEHISSCERPQDDFLMVFCN